MTSLISAVVVCSSGASAATVTLFRDAFDAEREVDVQGPAHLEHDALCVCGAKPDNDAVMSHWPVRSAGRKKRPSASVTRSTTMPLAACVAVTVAPGNAARTVPDDARDLTGVHLGDRAGTHR